MDLLANAITSIRLGVQDYQAETADRMLSAVRNVHAGILLLYKEALHRKSPEGSNDVLVKANLAPQIDEAGTLSFVGSGKKTVDVFQIKERFKSLEIATRWDLLDKIAEARNDLEHYIPKHSQDALKGLITNAFIIVRDFVTLELKEDPLQLLGEQTWQAMLEVASIHQEELKDCEEAMGQIECKSDALENGLKKLSCADCGSDLLKPSDQDGEIYLQCSRCGTVEPRETYVAKAIKEALAGKAYRSLKDGGDDPYTDCPECGNETYVMSEKRCAYCLIEAEHECQRCGTDIPASEMMSSPYCGYCEYMHEKMLAE